MAARAQAARSNLRDEHGQSVLEFVFMLPVLLGLIVIMVRSNTAIQMSIVNQKYARAQALWLTFNSPHYPKLSFRTAGTAGDQFVQYGFNRMVIGMAETPVDDTGGKPTASMQPVTRGGVPAPEGPSQSEPIDRAQVRIRTTVALCTQTNAIVTSEGLKAATAANIGENTVFDYCRGED